MNLREKVIRGFVETSIENEDIIVRNLLQTGRIEREEWEEISGDLQELVEQYEKEEITSEEFIKQRKEITKGFNKSKEEKKAGLTGEKAEELYEQIRGKQREALKQAYMESSYSTLRISAKILSARIKFIIDRIKNM